MIQIRLNRKRNYISAAVIAFLLVAAIVIPQLKSSYAGAAGETFTGSATFSGQAGVPIHITNLQLNATGNPTLPVKLQVSTGALALGSTTGLTFTGSQSGRTLEFSGTKNDINAALLTLTYQRSTVGSSSIEVSLIGAGEIYNPTNGHLYEFINNELDWDGARAEAIATSKNGAQGYLATITSAEENEFVSSRLTGEGWMGAGDFGSGDEDEGDWKWVGGPENGTSFWSGLGLADGGAPVGGRYSNWNDGEPNNAGNEDCAQYLSGNGGWWNDLPCSGLALTSYAIEYGAPGNLPSVAFKDITVNAQPVSFAGGNGTVQAPYQITDCQRLQGVSQNLSANYVLTANVDCSETIGWNGGAGFDPIGNDGAPFTGTFNGQGYAIDALHIIRADDLQYTNSTFEPETNEDNVGFFGRTQNATIQNFNITNSKIKGFQFVGGIIGYMDGGTLANVTFNIGVADNSCDPGLCVWARYGYEGGGLVGHLESGTVSNSRTAGPVKGSGTVIGGLVGMMVGGTLQDSSSSSNTDGGTFIGGAIGMMLGGTATRVHVSGAVDANLIENYKDGKYAGGFVGSVEGGVISQSYATGNVIAEAGVAGGFAGTLMSNANNSITDSYSTGSVSSVDGEKIGGFVGEMYEGIINRAYASGSVSANGNTGGFAGNVYNGSTISNSFAVGSTDSDNGATGGFFAETPQSVIFTDNFYDVTRTGQSGCDGGVTVGCTGVNASSSQPNYFIDLRNNPFTRSGTAIWNNATVWYFDAVNLPVLRLGNTTPSVVMVDDDNDGISAAIENAAPNGGDANYDGTLDSEQANVASFVNPVTNTYTVLAVDDECAIQAISAADESTKAALDPDYTYPAGLVSYTVDCGTPGFTANVSVYFYGFSADSFVVRKYNSSTEAYASITGTAITTAVNYTRVSYSITDGGILDEDGVADGVIVDPVGLAVPFDAAATPGVPNTGVQILGNAFTQLAFMVGGVVAVLLSAVGIQHAAKRRN